MRASSGCGRVAACCRQREALQLADAHRGGAEGKRFDDVGAAEDAAVPDDLGAARHRIDHFRQHFDRRLPVIELTSAMVRHVDDVGANMRDGARLRRGGDARSAAGQKQRPCDECGACYTFSVANE